MNIVCQLGYGREVPTCSLKESITKCLSLSRWPSLTRLKSSDGTEELDNPWQMGLVRWVKKANGLDT